MKKVYDIVLNGHNRSPVHLTHRVGRTKERKVSNFKKENLCFKWTPCWAQLLVQVFLAPFFCTLLVPVNATMVCGEGVSAAVIFCVRSSCFPCEVGQSVTSPEQQRLLTSYPKLWFRLCSPLKSTARILHSTELLSVRMTDIWQKVTRVLEEYLGIRLVFKSRLGEAGVTIRNGEYTTYKYKDRLDSLTCCCRNRFTTPRVLSESSKTYPNRE